MTPKEQSSSINAMHQIETPKQELNVKKRTSQQLQSRMTTNDASGYPMNSNEQSKRLINQDLQPQSPISMNFQTPKVRADGTSIRKKGHGYSAMDVIAGNGMTPGLPTLASM